MSESGCLKTEKYNSMNINDRIISNSFNGGRLELKSKPGTNLESFSREVKDIDDDNENDDYSIHDGAFLTLTNNKTLASYGRDQDAPSVNAATNGNYTTLSGNIPWPDGSYIQDISIVFKNVTNPLSVIDFGTNTIHIKLDAVLSPAQTSSGNAVAGTIMSYKKIGTAAGEGLGKVFKNIPIPIIKHCTGIHPESLLHCAALHGDTSRVENQEFSIMDPDENGCWIKTNYADELDRVDPVRARGYPLYRPQNGNGRPDSLELTLEITTTDGTDGSDRPSGSDATALADSLADTHLLVIVTYMKMNLEDIDF